MVPGHRAFGPGRHGGDRQRGAHRAVQPAVRTVAGLRDGRADRPSGGGIPARGTARPPRGPAQPLPGLAAEGHRPRARGDGGAQGRRPPAAGNQPQQAAPVRAAPRERLRRPARHLHPQAHRGRTAPGQGNGRRGHAAQERLPGQHEPRDPHPHERHHRHGPPGPENGARPAPGGLRAQDTRRGPASSGHPQRHPRLLQDRGGQADGGEHRVRTGNRARHPTTR